MPEVRVTFEMDADRWEALRSVLTLPDAVVEHLPDPGLMAPSAEYRRVDRCREIKRRLETSTSLDEVAELIDSLDLGDARGVLKLYVYGGGSGGG